MSIFAEDYTREVKVEDITVKIKKLSLKDQMEAAKKFNDGEEAAGSVDLLMKSIVEWNAKDKENKVVPITIEVIGKMRGDLAIKLTEAVTDFNSIKTDEAKN